MNSNSNPHYGDSTSRYNLKPKDVVIISEDIPSPIDASKSLKGKLGLVVEAGLDGNPNWFGVLVNLAEGHKYLALCGSGLEKKEDTSQDALDEVI